MSNPFTDLIRLYEVARLGYDAITYLFTGGPTHDYDREHDGADRLAEAEEDIDAWEPQDMQPDHRGEWKEDFAHLFAAQDVQPDLLPDWEDTPEPQLTADELVAVRELIEERFPDFAGTAASLADGGNSPGACGGNSPGACCVTPSVREDKQQGPRLPTGPQHRPASVEHPPDSAPDAGHPTSELLAKAADMLIDLAFGIDPAERLLFVAELRDRAEALAIKDEG